MTQIDPEINLIRRSNSHIINRIVRTITEDQAKVSASFDSPLRLLGGVRLLTIWLASRFLSTCRSFVASVLCGPRPTAGFV